MFGLLWMSATAAGEAVPPNITGLISSLAWHPVIQKICLYTKNYLCQYVEANSFFFFLSSDYFRPAAKKELKLFIIQPHALMVYGDRL